MSVYVVLETDDSTREVKLIGVFTKKRDALIASNKAMRENFPDVPRGRGVRPNPFEFANKEDKDTYNYHKSELRNYGETTIGEDMNYMIKESELTS